MKNILKTVAILGVFMLYLPSCEEVEIPEPVDRFINLDDNTTTAINANIPRLDINVNGNSVTASISVTDQNGLPLENFRIGNYQIREVVQFSDTTVVNARLIEPSEVEELPLGLSAVVDYSGSLSALDIENSENALRQFVSIKDDEDVFSIIKFSTGVNLIQDFTNDTDLLNNAINSSYPSGFTAFYDACQLALQNSKLNDISNNFFPVIVTFTDGGDTGSSTFFSSLINNSIACGIPIYNIGIGGADQVTLNTLSSSTGGRALFAPTSAELGDLYAQISKQLSTLYTVEWNYSSLPGTTVTVVVDVEYTAAGGTFTNRALGTYTVP